VIILLALFAGGDGYRVEENNKFLMLGWHSPAHRHMSYHSNQSLMCFFSPYC
jgi:hypothetical protein